MSRLDQLELIYKQAQTLPLDLVVRDNYAYYAFNYLPKLIAIAKISQDVVTSDGYHYVDELKQALDALEE